MRLKALSSSRKTRATSVSDELSENEVGELELDDPFGDDEDDLELDEADLESDS